MLQILAILISGTQTMTLMTSRLRYTGGRNGQGKTTKMYFPAALNAILHEEHIEKESEKFRLNLLYSIQAKDLLTKIE